MTAIFAAPDLELRAKKYLFCVKSIEVRSKPVVTPDVVVEVKIAFFFGSSKGPITVVVNAARAL